MSVDIQLNTPLAAALNEAIKPKLVDMGWGSGGEDDTTLSEYIILMLVNRKTQDEIASELSGDLLNLGPDDPVAREFSSWLFGQIEQLNAQLNGGAPAPSVDSPATVGAAEGDVPMDGDADHDMDMASGTVAGINAPTGPRAMRGGAQPRGRERRMMGQINRALDRTSESVLHRVRGQSGTDRISTHNRAPPTGPRMGAGRLPRGGANNRAASLAAGLAGGMGRGFPGGPGAMNMGGVNGANGWAAPDQQQPQFNIYAMLEQQAQMMQQMQHQLMMQTGGGQAGGFPQQQQQGKSLFERVQRPQNNFRKAAHQTNGQAPPQQQQQQQGAAEGSAAQEGEDVEMGQTKREPPNPEDTVCKYNLSCTNKDCKFAHQSPAAPPGTTVDVKDVCSFGAACKNRKCVGRHPSPASRTAHQGEQDCKFYPNCQNPRCPFRHPAMPPCRNGGDCAVPNCKFTHVQTACKFRPCTNRFCPFKHEEGQRGVFQDKVWTPEGGGHVSERKFVDEQAAEDVVVPEADNDMGGTAEEVKPAQEVIT